MSESKEITLHTQGELEDIRRRVNTIMVNMVDRTVMSMDKMSRRLEEVDAAMDRAFKIEEMNPQQLLAYTSYIRDSFRLKQDFLRTLSGYDINISKVPVQAEASAAYDEAQAEALRQEVMERGTPKG